MGLKCKMYKYICTLMHFGTSKATENQTNEISIRG